MQFIEKEKCTGCAACSNVCPNNAISMNQDSEGFYYPNIHSDKCIHCSLCEHVCPVLHAKTVNAERPKAYLAWMNDMAERDLSTSGGAFQGLALSVLNAGGVVFGVQWTKPGVAEHVAVDAKEALPSILRSKYVQSAVGNSFQLAGAYLAGGRQVLFSGTPCQVYGLLSFLKMKHISAERLITVDVICHGVPSPKVLSEYVKCREKEFGSALANIDLRTKKHNAPYSSESMTCIAFEDGRKMTYPSNYDYIGLLLHQEICLRRSCHQCVFKTIGRMSDISIGDCWFSRALSGRADIPFDVTLAVVHSERGRSLLMGAESLDSIEVDIEKAAKCNGGMLYESIQPHPMRDAFMDRVGKEDLGALAHAYFPGVFRVNASSFKKPIKNILRFFTPPRMMKKIFFQEKQKEFEHRCAKAIPTESWKKTVL